MHIELRSIQNLIHEMCLIHADLLVAGKTSSSNLRSTDTPAASARTTRLSTPPGFSGFVRNSWGRKWAFLSLLCLGSRKGSLARQCLSQVVPVEQLLVEHSPPIVQSRLH